MRANLLCALLVAALTACAPRPVITVAQRGEFPRPATFALIESDGSSEKTEEALTSNLRERGFTTEGDARLLFQVVRSDLPGRTGLYAPSHLEDADQQRWLTSPARSRSTRTRSLTVSVTDLSTGNEVYRAYGTERYRAGNSDQGSVLERSVLALLPSIIRSEAAAK